MTSFAGVFSRYVPPAIDAINTYYGHGNIPVAIQKPVDNTVRDSFVHYFRYRNH